MAALCKDGTMRSLNDQLGRSAGKLDGLEWYGRFSLKWKIKKTGCVRRMGEDKGMVIPMIVLASPDFPRIRDKFRDKEIPKAKSAGSRI